MDDSDFDKRIRSTVEGYEGVEFDPSAMAALHYQVAAASGQSLYARFRTETIIGSGFIILMLINFLMWHSLSLENQQMHKYHSELVQELKQQSILILGLRNTIDGLQNANLTSRSADNIGEKSQVTEILNRLAQMEKELRDMKVIHLDKVPAAPDLHPDVEYPLYHRTHERNSYVPRTRIQTLNNQRVKSMSAQARPESGMRSKSGDRIQLDAATLRDMEKHYRKGVGIRLGVTADLSTGYYETGYGKADFSFGILGDFILSPVLSIETGFKYFNRRTITLDGEEMPAVSLPAPDHSLGILQQAEIENRVIEFPLNLKFRYPAFPKLHFTGGIGYSALAYSQQNFEYEFAYADNPSVILSTAHSYKSLSVYPGAINIMLGFARNLERKNLFEANVYYQYGTGETGQEKIRGNFLGLRGVYWFPVRQ